MQVPSTTLLTDGSTYCFYRYLPRKDGPFGSIIRSELIRFDWRQGVAERDVRRDVQQVVEKLVGVALYQKSALDSAVGKTEVSCCE